jgi:hypothetical protein
MATKTWNPSADSLFALSSGGTNLGGGKDQHLVVGYWSGYRFRSAIQFALDWTGVTQIQSAVLYLKTTTQVHVAFGSSPDIYIERCTSSWQENSASADGGGAWTNTPTAWPGPSSTTTGRSSLHVSTAENTWVSVDITSIVEDWAPTTVKRRDGSAGGGAANYGILLRAVNGDTDSTETTEFYSREAGSSVDPYIVLTYSTNSPPNAPTNVKLGGASSGSIITGADTTPTLTFTGNDPDAGDVLAKYDVQVDTTTGNGVEPDWAGLHSQISGGTTGISGQNVTVDLPVALSRGQWYAIRCRTYDGSNAVGAWSATAYFKLNQLPSATASTSGVAPIWNLDDATLWTSGGSHAKAQLRFTVSDPDGQTITAYELRIKTSPGGAPVYTASGSGAWASGSTITVNVDYGLVNGTTYYYDVRVQDSIGEWSAYSAEASFRVRWGQARYEYNAGASSANWSFSSGALTGTGADVTFLFGTTATSGATPATWYSTISAAEAAKGTNPYMQVLVRLSGSGSAPSAPPALADMTFRYLGAATQPDQWTFVPSAEWTLDSSVRRYGSQALRCAVQSGVSGNRYIYPYRQTPGDDVPVLPSTTYTLSAWVKTQGTLVGGYLTVRIFAAGSLSIQRAASATITNSASAPGSQDGWARLTVTYTTGAGETAIRPMVHYNRTAASSDVFWVDAVKLEEGSVATPWLPGMVGDPVVLDSNGLIIDGSAGGIMRLRGTDGGSRSTIALGPSGLVFASDTEVYSHRLGGLVITKGGGTDNEIYFPPQTNDPGRIIHTENNNVAGLLLSASDDRGSTDYIAFGSHPAGTWSEALRVRTDGVLEWSGTALERDVNLYRAAANVLRTDDTFRVGNYPTPNSTELGLGYLELRGSAPFIDFANDAAADYDVRLQLASDTVLALTGGVLRHASFPGFFWYYSSNTGIGAIANGGTVTVSFSGTPTRDAYAFWSSATPTRITIPAALGAGVYLIQAMLDWGSVASSNGSGRLVVRLNGTTNIAQSDTWIGSGNGFAATLVSPYLFAAGDYVELLLTNFTGQTRSPVLKSVSLVLLSA